MIDEKISGDRTIELGRLLRSGRTAQGWTLRRAAAETGISNGYLSLIEQGDVKAPSPTYLLILAEKYGLPFDRLMALAGHPSGQSPASAIPSGSGTVVGSGDPSPPPSRRLRPSTESVGGGPIASVSAVSPADAREPNPALVSGGMPVVEMAGEESAKLASGVAIAMAGRSAGAEEADEWRHLRALVLDDMRALSSADIAQVRAFIAGLRAARRS